VASQALVGGYARALFSVAAAEGALPAVEDELFAFGKALERHLDLREALTDAALPTERKRAVVDELLGERVHPVTLGLLGFVIDLGRAREIPEIVEELARMAATEREHVLGEVRAAVDLSGDQRERLAQALSLATGRVVDVKVVVDPSVIAGVVARVGDMVFDGSVAGRLQAAKHAMGSTS
jgi:F-type H+-transporting ATPase subunit delta